ncbi:MAG: type II secretion system protein [Candidatus Staskawiczbacteria bacterium]|nr:type II secretion system protein [Candidatus Staskawiczbacteria bacterium]
MTIYNLKFKNNKGFTIVELIVVMAVFLFIVGVAIGIFLSIVGQQKKVLAQQQLLNQVSYAEEYMSKALRMATTDVSGNCLGEDHMGYIYLLTRTSASGGIKFINQSNGYCQEFFFDNYIHGDLNSPMVLKELKGANGVSNGNDDDAAPIISGNLQITSANVYFNGGLSDGVSNADNVQPRLTIFFNINVLGESAMPVQITVSQRNLNVK